MLDLPQARPVPAASVPLDPAAIIEGEGVQVSPGPPLDRLVLRGDPAAFALDLPHPVGATAATGHHAALCLGPDEWLLLAPPGDRSLAELREFDGPAGAAFDAGQRQVALLVTGPSAPTLLNAGCPLDLHDAAFPSGRCTRTVLAKAEIVLWRRTPNEFHLEVGRSFAAYVWAFLVEAARGMPLPGPSTQRSR